MIFKLLGKFNDFSSGDVTLEALALCLREMLNQCKYCIRKVKLTLIFPVSNDVVMRLLFSNDLGQLDGKTRPNEKDIRRFVEKMTMRYIQRWIAISKEEPVSDRPWNLIDSCLQSLTNNDSAFPMFDAAGITEWTLNIFEVISKIAFYASARACTEASMYRTRLWKTGIEMTTSKMRSLISWNSLTENTYYCGIVREGFRVAQLASARVEPILSLDRSEVLDGHTLPAGTKLDLSAMRKSDFFGPDESQFRPERWEKSKDETTREWDIRIHDLKEADQLFYTGLDSSPPKALARMIVLKLVYALALNLQVTLVSDPIPDSPSLVREEQHAGAPNRDSIAPTLVEMG